MKPYSVEVSDAALAAIADHSLSIELEAGSPLEADRWVDRVNRAIASLSRWPGERPPGYGAALARSARASDAARAALRVLGPALDVGR